VDANAVERQAIAVVARLGVEPALGRVITG
jgi:hypothetical protein